MREYSRTGTSTLWVRCRCGSGKLGTRGIEGSRSGGGSLRGLAGLIGVSRPRGSCLWGRRSRGSGFCG